MTAGCVLCGRLVIGLVSLRGLEMESCFDLLLWVKLDFWRLLCYITTLAC